MIRPTPRAAGCLALTIAPALLIVAAFERYWFAALYPPAAVLGLMLADLLMIMPGRRLKVGVEAPGLMYLGRPAGLQVSLSAEPGFRPPAVEALLEQEGQAEPPEARRGTLTDGRLELSLPVRPLRRGQILLKALWLRWRGPWGLTELRRREELALKIDVVPDIKGLHEEALKFFAGEAIYGLKIQRLRGEGAEFDALAEYAPGQDLRHLDWKHSARHRRLLVKEFRQERNHQVLLGFDTGHLMLEPVEGLPKLDHAIRAGLLLGWISLYRGDLLGGCGFDVSFRHYLQPARGLPHFTRFQRFAAALDYQTEESNFTLALAELGARLRRRTLVVLFTEFVDSISAELLIESLQLMTRRHVVIFVTLRDPLLAGLTGAAPEDFSRVAGAVIADDFLRERSIVLERVARLGVHCLDVPARGLSSALLNRYLMIKQRGLL